MATTPLTLFKFQSDAVAAAATSLSSALTEAACAQHRGAPFKYALKAPTGSGKTLMMLHTLQKVLEATPTLVVLWLASKNLAEQTTQRLSRALQQQQGSSLSIPFTHITSNSDLQYHPGHLYVLNWEACSTPKHLLIRPNEQGLNLAGFLQDIRTANSPVLVVVDEAHAIVDSPDSNGHALVYDTLQPAAIFGASATFTDAQLGTYSAMHQILPEQAIAAGLVVKHTTAYCIPQATDYDLMLEAYRLQQSLTDAYASENSTVKPLILVQVPNSRDGSAAIEGAVRAFSKVGYQAGVEIRAHLSEKTAIALTPAELAAVSDSTSAVKVLIFKVGLATGWDCPRAKILVALRDTKSDILNHQVLGRIARQPEARQYTSDRLNQAYLLTSLQDTALLKQVANIKKTHADLKISVQPVSSVAVKAPPIEIGRHWLPSLISSQQPLVSFNFSQANEWLRARLDAEVWRWPSSEATITQVNLDRPSTKSVSQWEGGTSEPLEIQTACEVLARQHLQSLKTPSVPKLTATIVRTFFLNLQDYALAKPELSCHQWLTLWRDESWRYFVTMLFEEYLLKALHPIETSASQPPSINWEQSRAWCVPSHLELTGSSASAPDYLSLDRSAVQSHRAIPVDSKLETEFMEFLENKDLTPQVCWWLKNPRTEGNLRIPYLGADNQLHHFVPDFIVLTTSGAGYTVFVLDTKDTHTATSLDAVSKHAALVQWASRTSTAELPVKAGFVQFKRGIWWLHAGASPYNATTGETPSGASGWTDLAAAFKS